jgi:hypothetical protein
MESKCPERVQIVSLSEEDRRTISSALQRNISEAIPADASTAGAAAQAIGIYVDPPGACIPASN